MKIHYAVILLLLVSSFSLSCQKADKAMAPEESEAVTAAEDQSLASQPAADRMMLKREAPSGGESGMADEGKKQHDTGRGIQYPFYTKFDKIPGRQLEYRVDLNFETKDLFSSRQKLLEIVKKYGFIRSSTSSIETSNIFLSAHIAVKSSELYDALLDLQNLGVLLNERISVTDHTEEMVLAERKIKREQLRIARKNRAIDQVAPGAKSWTEREQSLERSEDELDKKEHDQWKIIDNVYWADVHLYIRGPVTADTIEVPRYQNALIGLLNGFLTFLYGLIYLVPFLVIALIIWIKRDRIRNMFKRKKE